MDALTAEVETLAKLSGFLKKSLTFRAKSFTSTVEGQQSLFVAFRNAMVVLNN